MKMGRGEGGSPNTVHELLNISLGICLMYADVDTVCLAVGDVFLQFYVQKCWCGEESYWVGCMHDQSYQRPYHSRSCSSHGKSRATPTLPLPNDLYGYLLHNPHHLPQLAEWQWVTSKSLCDVTFNAVEIVDENIKKWNLLSVNQNLSVSVSVI